MSEFAVLINGLPGAGKTTLAANLHDALGMPVVAKDAIKEALAEAVDVRLPTQRLGALASDVMWSIVRELPEPAIVESFWLSGRDDAHFSSGLEVAGIRRGVEIWCHAPLDVMRSRIRTRPRHFVHQDEGRHEEWEFFAQAARPISRFPVISCDTGKAVDLKRLATEIMQHARH
jgi:predicted kinase